MITRFLKVLSWLSRWMVGRQEDGFIVKLSRLSATDGGVLGNLAEKRLALYTVHGRVSQQTQSAIDPNTISRKA